MQIEFQILDALQKIHTPVLDGVMCLITSLGNAGIIWILLTIALLINPKIRTTVRVEVTRRKRQQRIELPRQVT